VLIATRVLLGAAEGPFFPIALHHLYGWFAPRDRHLPTAWVTVGGAAGVLVSAPLLTWIIDSFGWRAAFGFLGVVGLVWGAVWSVHGKQGPEPADEEAAPAGSADGSRVPYRRILLTGTWLSGAAVTFAAYWYLASFLTWTTDYWQSAGGLTHTQASAVVMGSAAAAAVILLGYGVLAQRMQRAGRERALDLVPGVSVCVSGAATAVFAVSDQRALSIALMLTLMPLHTVALVGAPTAVARLAPAAQRGIVLGSLAFVYSLAGGFSPAVVGRIVDGAATTAAGYRTAYLLAAVLMLLTGAAALRFLRPARDTTVATTAPGTAEPARTAAEPG
jgi:predicted MFS family arabinose efflux permease